MMSRYILDASALLAWRWRETGGEHVEDLLAEGRCAISSVNLAEVLAKALDKGLPPEQLDTLVANLELEGPTTPAWPWPSSEAFPPWWRTGPR